MVLTVLNKKMELVAAAQKIYATFSQEQVDVIFKAAALAANRARIPLAVSAVAETGMGRVEDKIIKNHFASEEVFNKYKDLQTCGVIESDEVGGLTKIAKPKGVILATGGPAMVHGAYASGNPAIGVGAGNTPVLVDETADVENVVGSVMVSKVFDYGLICASEQSIVVLKTMYNKVRK